MKFNKFISPFNFTRYLPTYVLSKTIEKNPNQIPKRSHLFIIEIRASKEYDIRIHFLFRNYLSPLCELPLLQIRKDRDTRVQRSLSFTDVSIEEIKACRKDFLPSNWLRSQRYYSNLGLKLNFYNLLSRSFILSVETNHLTFLILSLGIFCTGRIQ